MANLQQFVGNLVFGVITASVSFLLFGLAVWLGFHNQISPRSWARPKNILKNVLSPPYSYSWIFWSARQTYPDLLAGIPGTGTRRDGWVGPNLKVNLDGIIMIRYHVLLFKLSALATLLCITVILPMNTTAVCDPRVVGIGSCLAIANLTDFEQTTIANIPPMAIVGLGGDAEGEIDRLWVPTISERYFAMAIVALVLYWYTCRLLWNEWLQSLALRRIYYLEHDHYKERMLELEEIDSLHDPIDDNVEQRHPWLPHPELRETLPNISLYSSLYQLPQTIATTNLPDDASDLERKLSATVDFFDRCIPCPPGFSSSVAAVTILPEPRHVARAWKRWYICGKRLRKLRFIRSQIQRRMDMEKQRSEPQDVTVSQGEQQDKPRKEYETGGDGPESRKPQMTEEGNTPGPGHRFSYASFDAERAALNAGFHQEVELRDRFEDTNIEQLGIYAREYAQSSSKPCPFGLGEAMMRLSSLEQLQQWEEIAQEQVEEANDDLVSTREKINELMSGEIVQIDHLKPASSSEEAHDARESVEANGIYEENLQLSTGAQLRQRAAHSTQRSWDTVQNITRDMSQEHREVSSKSRLCAGLFRRLRRDTNAVRANTKRMAEQVLSSLALNDTNFASVVNVLEHPTYAVVTFTSRQSAISARQCMADGRGLDRWQEVDELPVAPLADAPPWSLFFCRSYCRPVSLTISAREKRFRKTCATILFLAFCLLYTVPLTLTSQLLDPAKLAEITGSESLQDPDSFFYRFLSGISSGFLYSIFFSICPQLFLALANFEGNASSKKSAEDKALQYFWFFMLATAFTGTTLAQMFFEGIVNGLNIGAELKDVLVTAANSIPTQQAPVWMNWIIVRFTYTLPFMYLLQASTFAFTCTNLRWCGRLMRGGGPGSPPPYRIYVDSGTVLMCVVAIAPVCPLIAPLAFAYSVMILAMLPWLLCFVYRPFFDGGGHRWPKLHDITISATIFGQVLLATTFLLRSAIIPGVMIIVAILPTYHFGEGCKAKFLRAFKDAGLLQTSNLDDFGSSATEREEYRKWLVDCHKASYVPICLSAGNSLLTVEAAQVEDLELRIVADQSLEPAESPSAQRRQRLFQNIISQGRSRRELDDYRHNTIETV